MKFFETSKYHSFKKSTYITLRWIGIIGQLIAVNFVHLFLNPSYDFINSNLVIFLGILSNLYLIFIYKKTQLSDRSAFIFLVIDILQLGSLLYLTGGVANPFVIFLLIPSIFSSSHLSFKTNFLLVFLTMVIILILTFYRSSVKFLLVPGILGLLFGGVLLIYDIFLWVTKRSDFIITNYVLFLFLIGGFQLVILSILFEFIKNKK